MNKQRAFAFLFVLCFLLCLAIILAFFFIPHTIDLSQPFLCESIHIGDESDFISINLSSSDEFNIISCINQYKGKPSIIKANASAIFISKIEFRISDGSQYIYISKNGECISYHTPFWGNYAIKYDIINGSAMRKELIKLLADKVDDTR